MKIYLMTKMLSNYQEKVINEKYIFLNTQFILTKMMHIIYAQHHSVRQDQLDLMFQIFMKKMMQRLKERKKDFNNHLSLKFLNLIYPKYIGL